MQGDSLQTAVEAQVGAHVPGLAVVATTPDCVVLSRAWGFADVSSRAAMTVDTVCNWFSMTKPVTATVVAILAERGLLDLDDRVQALYEPFTVTRPESRRRAVTVRHLLSHSSGLANPLPLRWVRRPDEPAPARSRFVEHLIDKHARLRFDPGSRASYSNLGFLVLGEIIEAVTGQTYEECVEDCLLRPLGMQRTGFTAPADGPWATPYQRRRTIFNTLLPVLLPRRIIGANEGRYRALDHFYVTGASYGGLIGPSVEAARFLQLHLGDGERDGRRLLPTEAAQAMRTVQARGRKLAVGSGWYRRGRTGTSDYVEHLGGGVGFWNCMRLYPERGLGIVMMGNATSYDHDSIACAALRQLA